MTEGIYALCALTSVMCAVLLHRGWRKSNVRLLLWSSVCFAGLALSNVLLFVDHAIIRPDFDLALIRTATTLVSLSILLVGMIWESRA